MIKLNTIRQESNSSDKARIAINSMYADDKCCGGCCNPGYKGPVKNPDDNMFTEKESEISAEEQFQAYLPKGKKTLKFLVDAEKNLGFKPSAFDKILEARIVKTREILTAKEKEYAAHGGRFHNFKVAARRKNETPEQALYGMMLKHEVSVQDMVEWTESCPERITRELIDSKIGDNINYLCLLEGLLLERIKQRDKTFITAGLE